MRSEADIRVHDRVSDGVDERLRWRCRRGMLELDLLLQGFLERGYAQLSPQYRRTFECMLEEADQQLLEWLMGREVPQDREVAHVIERIRRCTVP